DAGTHDLPSFPTRRSSDLGAPPAASTDGDLGREPAVGDAVRGLHGVDALDPPPAVLRLAPLRSASADRRAVGSGGGAQRSEPEEDRKSTRLNSSHDQISYA